MNRLKELRKERKLKQSDLANFLKVTTAAYCNYENEQRQMNPEMLQKLADFFNVSVDYLLGRDLDEFSILHSNDALKLNEKLIEAGIDPNQILSLPTEKQKAIIEMLKIYIDSVK